MEQKKKVILLAGPTASGKSKLALTTSKKFRMGKLSMPIVCKFIMKF